MLLAMRLRFGWIGLLAVLVAAPAFAQPRGKKPIPEAKVEGPIDVETAESYLTKLDYDKANDVAGKVVKQSGLSHDQLVRAYKVLAVTDAILDKEEASRDAFLTLLVLDPDYAVDSALGPKVHTPFVEARGQFRSLPSKPGIDATAAVRDRGGQLRIVTHDPTHIAKKVTVGYRWTSSGEYTTSQLPVGEGAVDVVAAPKGRTRLDFYALAFDANDNAVFEAGTPLAPKSAFAEVTKTVAGGGAPPKEKEKSIFASPVLWLVTGAALAGGGAALFFLLRPSDPPTTAALSPQIRCGDEPCK